MGAVPPPAQAGDRGGLAAEGPTGEIQTQFANRDFKCVSNFVECVQPGTGWLIQNAADQCRIDSQSPRKVALLHRPLLLICLIRSATVS